MADQPKHQPGGSVRRSQRHTGASNSTGDKSGNTVCPFYKIKGSGPSTSAQDQLSSSVCHKSLSGKRRSGHKASHTAAAKCSKTEHHYRSNKKPAPSVGQPSPGACAESTGPPSVGSIRTKRRSSQQSNPEKEPSKTLPQEVQVIQTVQKGHCKHRTSESSSLTESKGRKRKHSSTSVTSDTTTQNCPVEGSCRLGVAASLRSNSQASVIEGIPYYPQIPRASSRSRSRSRSKSTEQLSVEPNPPQETATVGCEVPPSQSKPKPKKLKTRRLGKQKSKKQGQEVSVDNKDNKNPSKTEVASEEASAPKRARTRSEDGNNKPSLSGQVKVKKGRAKGRVKKDQKKKLGKKKKVPTATLR